MMTVEIDRVRIALHGVSAEIVEAASSGLEQEITRRLESLGVASRLQTLDIGELSLGPLHSTAVLDAGALRNIIADRLAEGLSQRLTEDAVAGESA